MRAILVDDEKQSADNLHMLLEENCPEIEVIASCQEADEAIATILQLRPEVLFLDIEMPFADGFTVLEAIQEINPKTIFTTAYEMYALKAFRTSACDYLLKPIDPAELRDAVQKLRSKPVRNSELLQHLDAMRHLFNPKRPGRLAIQDVEGYHMVNYEEVIHLEAASNYTHIYCSNKRKYTVARVLKDFDEQLVGDGFFRAHSSHLVNLSHIEKYQRGRGGYLFMSDGTQIEVSRNRKKELIRVLLGEE